MLGDANVGDEAWQMAFSENNNKIHNLKALCLLTVNGLGMGVEKGLSYLFSRGTEAHDRE